MNTFERAFVAANKWALILLLAGMSGVVFANVALRYLTNFSIIWAEEVARYAMIWMTLLGAGLALRYGGHVAIGNLQEAMAPRVQRFMRALICLLLLAFFTVMVWIGYVYMMRMQFQLTPATRIPFSYVYAAIPMGFLLLIVHLLLVAKSYVVDNRFEESEEHVESTAAAG